MVSAYRVAVLVLRRLFDLFGAEDDLAATRLDVAQLVRLSHHHPSSTSNTGDDKHRSTIPNEVQDEIERTVRRRGRGIRNNVKQAVTKQRRTRPYIVAVHQVQGLDVGLGDGPSEVAHVLDVGRSSHVPRVGAEETGCNKRKEATTTDTIVSNSAKRTLED